MTHRPVLTTRNCCASWSLKTFSWSSFGSAKTWHLEIMTIRHTISNSVFLSQEFSINHGKMVKRNCENTRCFSRFHLSCGHWGDEALSLFTQDVSQSLEVSIPKRVFIFLRLNKVKTYEYCPLSWASRALFLLQKRLMYNITSQNTGYKTCVSGWRLTKTTEKPLHMLSLCVVSLTQTNVPFTEPLWKKFPQGHCAWCPSSLSRRVDMLSMTSVMVPLTSIAEARAWQLNRSMHQL